MYTTEKNGIYTTIKRSVYTTTSKSRNFMIKKASK